MQRNAGWFGVHFTGWQKRLHKLWNGDTHCCFLVKNVHLNFQQVLLFFFLESVTLLIILCWCCWCLAGNFIETATYHHSDTVVKHCTTTRFLGSPNYLSCSSFWQATLWRSCFLILFNDKKKIWQESTWVQTINGFSSSGLVEFCRLCQEAVFFFMCWLQRAVAVAQVPISLLASKVERVGYCGQVIWSSHSFSFPVCLVLMSQGTPNSVLLLVIWEY